MPKSLAPDVRVHFAARLKRLRIQHGFGKARHFARALGIEENRYTRYERGEVEPSLTLIRDICITLGVSVDQLLDFDADDTSTLEFKAAEISPVRPSERAQHALASSPVSGFAERQANTFPAPAVSRHEALAWRIASSAVEARKSEKPAAAEDPVEEFRETALIYRELLSEPFSASTRIAASPSLSNLAPRNRAALMADIRELTSSAAAAALGESGTH
jgi:transcriptional regulator with XRE-family HTH domain